MPRGKKKIDESEEQQERPTGRESGKSGGRQAGQPAVDQDVIVLRREGWARLLQQMHKLAAVRDKESQLVNQIVATGLALEKRGRRLAVAAAGENAAGE